MGLVQLRVVALGVAASMIVLSVVAAVIAESADLAPLGSVVLVVGGLLAWAGIGWLRQRPIAPGDDEAYGTTALIKIAIAEVPALAGFGLGIGFGPSWLALVGLGGSAVGLVLAWPSEADRERHQLLYLV